MWIAIALPTHRSLVDIACARSVMGLQDHFARNGIRWTFLEFDSAEIDRARNHLASMALKKGCTHVLFVDSDMVFSPSPVMAMINSKRDVIGCIYPRRSVSLEKVAQAGRRHTHDGAAIAEAVGFVLHNPTKPVFKDNIAEVDGVGMGLCLITTAALQRLAESGKVGKRLGPVRVGAQMVPYYGFFDLIIEGDVRDSEDLSFCKRWREICGGKVYALATDEISHIGRIEVRAPYPYG